MWLIILGALGPEVPLVAPFTPFFSIGMTITKELALPPDDSLMCPPSFLTGLKPELSIKDGSRLELKVQVKGDPDPQVSWLKDGKPISSNEIMEVKYKNG